MGAKYKSNLMAIEQLLNSQTAEQNSMIKQFHTTFKRRSLQIETIVKDYQIHDRKQQLNRPLSSIIMSFLHMTTNRMFVSQTREQELIIYDMLCRHYAKMVHINRKKTIENQPLTATNNNGMTNNE